MDIILNVLNQTLVFTVPLLVVALGGMFSERSGVVNIALEGIMIGGAFVGVYFIYLMQSANKTMNPQLLLILALIVAGIFGALLSLLHAFAAINLKADQTISGTAINMLAPGLGLFLAKLIFNGNSSVPFSNTFRIHEIPVLSQIPILGPILFKGAYITTYLGIVILILSVIFLNKTKAGLRLRACGENPQAADTMGINVYKMRYIGVLTSGFMGGLGGAIFAEAISGNFSISTIVGQGFMALAAVIFGKWNPIGAMLSSVFFGFAQSLSIIGNQLPIISNIPAVYMQIAPYVLTIIVLVLFLGKSVAPAADGINYIKSK